jgi:thiol-disulfide isomerase/thioredoxin
VLGAAAQDGTYPEAVERLKELKEKLAAEDDNDLAAYVEFRWMTASYNQELARPDVDYKKVQDQRLENLENYVERHPTSVDSAEAMWQLAMGQEFAGDDQNAIKWYNRVVKNFGKTATAVKSAGAVRRLESVGKTISLKGKSLGGRSVDLSAAKGKVVLIHYWASDIPACLVDLPAIEKMVNKYEPNLLVVGVSLDNSRQALETYLRANPLPWPNIWEEGGMENRLATEMGIIVEPTMILIDAKGKVVDRSTHAISLDNELKAMLKPNPNMATRPGKPN